MSSYNERPDDLTRFMKSIGWEFDENGYTFEDNYINFRTANILRQNITSLMKALVAEAKPGIHPYLDNEIDGGYAQAIYGAGVLNYQNNLLKALEEV